MESNEFVIVFKLAEKDYQKRRKKHSENERNQQALKRTEKIFERVFKDTIRCCSFVQFAKQLERRVFCESNEIDPRVEYPVQLDGNIEPMEMLKLLDSVSKHLKRLTQTQQAAGVSNGGAGDDDAAHYSIILPENDAGRVLRSSFKAHHADLPISAISFCNVLEHQDLITHTRVDEMSEKIQWVLENIERNRHLSSDHDIQPHHSKSRHKSATNGFAGPSGEVTRQTMNAEFEHDRKNLNVTFFNVSKMELKKKTENRAFVNSNCTSEFAEVLGGEAPSVVDVVDQIRLVIRYTSIRQIYWQIAPGGFGICHRLFFRLIHPPFVFKIRDVYKLGPQKIPQKRGGNRIGGGQNGFSVSEKRCKGSWDDTDKSIFYSVRDSPVFMLEFGCKCSDAVVLEILGRLQDLLKISVEIRNFVKTTVPSRPIQIDESYYDDFDFIYTLESFTNACGRIAIDQLVVEDVCRQFFDRIAEVRREDRKLTLDALEQLVQDLSDRKEVPLGGIQRLFEKILLNLRISGGVYAQGSEWCKNDGYVFLRRVMITPTRMIYQPRQMIMGNRVLRFDLNKYPVERFVRVTFRDEDFQKVFASKMPQELIDDFVGQPIRSGIFLGDRPFFCLGSSNSQIRDGGSYFVQIGEPCSNFHDNEFKRRFKELNDFRKRLGQFDTNNIPKMISRLGQCFTQAFESAVPVYSQMLGWDFTGSQNRNGKAYCFSDGCGSMSMAAAQRIAHERHFDTLAPPSCLQFRYAGYKGVLAVNPQQDEAMDFFIKNPVCKCHPTLPRDNLSRAREFLWGVTPCEHQKNLKAVHFYFRPSQQKFELTDAQQARCKMEIVKPSMPSPVAVNRQLVNIIDQVSHGQSRTTHQAIANRLQCLLDLYLQGICATLTDERAARRKLSSLPRFLDYRRLTSFDVVSEPFFRLLLRATARVAVQRARSKANIGLPSSDARMMFGVIDETGILQSGQVFFQYTNSMGDDYPNREGHFQLYTGKVMITKNPCIISGDVRMFDAVDVPALRHLVNVLIFPRYGHRPHSDEMAGSDLDGDEYSVIWDKELFLDYTEPAFDFTPENPDDQMPEAAPDDPVDLQRKIARFAVNYMSNDSIGRIANSHLINSDLYGLNTKISEDITKKHSQAVDFQKSGVPPDPLTKHWDGDNPPERFERAPDFMEKEEYEPQYISGRLNGQLFRRICIAGDSILAAINEERDRLLSSETSIVDQLLIARIPESDTFTDWWTDENGGKPWMDKATKLYQKYANSVHNIMENYGIECEGELFACTFSVLKNRLSQREDDEMSMFTTATTIERRFREVIRQTRLAFFEDFGGLQMVATDEDGLCISPTEDIKRLASACYLHVYDLPADGSSANRGGGRRLLSFAWASCYEVLNEIRRDNSIRTSGNYSAIDLRSLDPFGERVSAHITAFLHRQGRQLDEFRAKIHPDASKNRKGCPLLARYIRKYPSLDLLLFFGVEWARMHGLLLSDKGPFSELHICLLIVMHGLRLLPCEVFVDQTAQWLQMCVSDEEEVTVALNHPFDIATGTGGLGRKFVGFLRYLSSRDFQGLNGLDFGLIGSSSHFFNKEWIQIYTAASTTYHYLVFSLGNHQKVLPTSPRDVEIISGDGVDNEANNEQSQTQVVKCGRRRPLETVFVAEVPGFDWVCKQFVSPGEDLPLPRLLAKKTGCVAVHIRAETRGRMQNVWRGQRMSADSGELARPARLVISCWGTQQAILRLRRFFSVYSRLDLDTESRQRRVQLIPMQILQRLCSISPELQNAVHHTDSFGFLDRTRCRPWEGRRGGGNGESSSNNTETRPQIAKRSEMEENLARWIGVGSNNVTTNGMNGGPSTSGNQQ